MTSHQHHPGEQGPAEDRPPRGEDLAALLTRVIKEAGVPQKQIAKEAGVKYPTLHAWTKGTRGTSRIAPEILRSIVRVINSHGVPLTVREVFEAAGRHVPGPANEQREQRLLDLYRQLPEGKQRDLVRYVESLLRLSKV
ncbi:transcriptional regulator [Streptomyces sp. NPDC049590]|uniref:transcriptional regulator n=1 Tax=Streptomyces sp. NPDC049590 TaxID=3154834 RepID=UPI003426D07B